MAALRGVAVLVTRPERQANPLCALLESEGATAVRFPVLRIEAAGDGSLGVDLAAHGDSADVIIFTSANAVHFGAAWMASRGAAELAAIGPATSRALQEHGLGVTITPVGGVDSESLLRHPSLEHPAGLRILIVTGRNGREWLRERLTERGALVTVAEVYERVPTPHDSEQLAALAHRFSAGGIHVITATSVDVAAALVDLATPALRREFDHAHWLVPGTRIATALRGLGVTAPIIQADSAEDQSLVAALRRWRSSVSGA
jgi:uroporphyrinogen-III synthase